MRGDKEFPFNGLSSYGSLEGGCWKWKTVSMLASRVAVAMRVEEAAKADDALFHGQKDTDCRVGIPSVLFSLHAIHDTWLTEAVKRSRVSLLLPPSSSTHLLPLSSSTHLLPCLQSHTCYL